ncbi:alpha/beta hydrolase [Flavobacterium sp. ANB]|uniref:alpha/beta hydrolase-fold protein n=1 Tax=unclassified Flavobacterium TaxID=196869 RepID=UPI0012B97ABE|nr:MULTISPECIES: alpha/beta hydrolase-fold protein [unclassified Flavobacterium]MBF4517918.1 alpha/beta hydrolase [Flavobacterium sp. ANB]MTD71338.1 alpha/beta hydrolase [Flavobacterium sp. LC2016-13]
MIHNNLQTIFRKRIVFFCFLMVLVNIGFAQKKIEIGTIDSISSKILNEQRKIWVHLPGSAQQKGFSKEKYPVVYVLDGDAHFSSVVGMIEELSEVNGNTLCPEMIVVGILNTNRNRDLTPTHSDIDLPFVNKNSSEQSGGGEKFTEFLEKELIPYIDSKYPAAPYRTLVGHSLGGLTVINILTNHTNVFNSYVAIDPSMWWNHEKFLKETTQKLANKNLANVSLFMGIANTMDDDMDIVKVRKDTTKFTRHIRSILDLNDFLSQNKKSNLRYQHQYYKNDSHGSVPLIATYDALRFIFDFNELKLSIADRVNFNKAVFTKIEKHYENISNHFGYKVSVPERVVNVYGYQALSKKDNDFAGYLFKLNVTNFPESPNTYDSLGDFYEANGDKKNAIANYKKVLTLDKDFPETKEKLEKLSK